MKLSSTQIGMTFEDGDCHLLTLVGHIENATFPWVFKSAEKYLSYYNKNGELNLGSLSDGSDFAKQYAKKKSLVKCLGIVPPDLFRVHEHVGNEQSEGKGS